MGFRARARGAPDRCDALRSPSSVTPSSPSSVPVNSHEAGRIETSWTVPQARSSLWPRPVPASAFVVTPTERGRALRRRGHHARRRRRVIARPRTRSPGSRSAARSPPPQKESSDREPAQAHGGATRAGSVSLSDPPAHVCQPGGLSTPIAASASHIRCSLKIRTHPGYTNASTGPIDRYVSASWPGSSGPGDPHPLAGRRGPRDRHNDRGRPPRSVALVEAPTSGRLLRLANRACGSGFAEFHLRRP